MEEGSSSEVGELVIDVSQSDEEESTSNTETVRDGVDPVKQDVTSTQLEVCAAIPTAPEARLSPEASNCSVNPLLESMLDDCPSASTRISSEAPNFLVKDTNLVGIFGNYTPSELSRVTTQAMIECIAQFPALWDSRDASFTNFKYCSLLWKNIAVVINMPVKRIKKKWNNLRNSYKKEYFRRKASGIPSRFSYFEALSFLEEETLRQGEPGDSKKLQNSNTTITTNSTPNGLNGVNSDDDDDDDCMIIDDDDLQGTSSLGSSTVATTYETPSTNCTEDVSEMNNTQCGIDSDENWTPQLINGTSAGEQPRPAFIIRAKNISELIATPPPPPLEPAGTSGGRSSPDVVFIMEKSQSINRKRKITESDALPLSFDDLNDNPSSHDSVKANLESDLSQKSQKPKKKKAKLKKLKTSNDVLSNTGNTNSGTGKKLKTLPAKHSEPVPSTSQSYSTPGLSSDMRPSELREVNKGFLMSLLPDVEGMTNSQFRTFKKQATALVSMILNR